MSALKEIFICPSDNLIIRADQILEMYVQDDMLNIITEDTHHIVKCEDSDPQEELDQIIELMELS